MIHYLKYLRGLAAIRKAGIWFVDIPRTSSSSLRTELSQLYGNVYGKSDLLDAGLNVKQQIIPSHLTGREMRRRLGKHTWENLFTFSMVRNPWDRMVSIYNYRRQVREIDQTTPFEEYLQLFFNEPDSHESPYNYHGYYFQSIDYLTDEAGNIMVDYIARFENRDHDLEHIRKTGFGPLGKLFTQRSLSKPRYRSFYTPETREMVSTICKKDIEAFDYQF